MHTFINKFGKSIFSFIMLYPPSSIWLVSSILLHRALSRLASCIVVLISFCCCSSLSVLFCSVSRLSLVTAIGVLSSCVIAIIKFCCCCDRLNCLFIALKTNTAPVNISKEKQCLHQCIVLFYGFWKFQFYFAFLHEKHHLHQSYRAGTG